MVPSTGVWLYPAGSAAAVRDRVVDAEAARLDEVWLGDEGPGAADPFTVLGAAAGATTRLRLGVGVTNPYTRHPGVLATTARTLHELSGGRFVLGIGAGGHEALAALGLRAERPLSACRAALPLLRRWAPEVPVFVGARAERFNRWASEHCDGVLVSGVPPVLLEQVIGWARSIRPVAVALHLTCCTDDDVLDAARPRLLPGLVDGPAALRAGLDDDALRAAAGALAAGDDEPARHLVTVEVARRLVLAGSATEVGQALAAVARRHRPTSVGVAMLDEGLDRAAAVLGTCRRALA